GLNATKEQVEELRANVDNINYDVAEAREKEVRHDVMSHVYAYGQQCPNAKGIIHLGATSCYVGDNTDLIIMNEALELIKTKLLKVIALLKDFALKYKDLPTLGFTHFQAAQLTTVGKRATLWIWELLMDLENIDFQLSRAALLGCKGTTGTQASFMELFDNDIEKVKALDKKICEKMGYSKFYPVSGQTYSRKIDYQMLSVLSDVAQSAYKFANDIRLLQHLKEIEEPFEKSQIGSSAMAYKRNPMRSERICSLARYVIVDAVNPAITSSTQWFERTLDDSANKRISVAEAFLTVDAILNIYMNVASGLVVYPKVINKRIMSELPFMATENIMMDAVKNGGDRQELHERIRKHSMDAGKVVKEQGGENDLIERIVADDSFNLSHEEIDKILKPENFIGRSVSQVEEFIDEYVNPVLDNNDLAEEVELTV
ncbi:adenylosuccinate lyase, partial [Monoglobus pectinilyticus]|uniref:adenylosuccinate lyase n=1 Tax=Monoglobus pectinilyticus TaxID=1981510 RepID=UPI003AB439D3